jgi:hypothetical protein
MCTVRRANRYFWFWFLVRPPRKKTYDLKQNICITSSCLVLPLFFNRWRRWLFLTCLTIRLIQKIYLIIIYFVMSCFITHNTLSVIYILYICIKFLNKMNGQTCKKKQRRHLLKNGGSTWLKSCCWLVVFDAHFQLASWRYQIRYKYSSNTKLLRSHCYRLGFTGWTETNHLDGWRSDVKVKLLHYMLSFVKA